MSRVCTHLLINPILTRACVRAGGALADPVDTGLLVFTDKGVAESFAQQDPYVANGLVTKWTVRQWTVVAGSKL